MSHTVYSANAIVLARVGTGEADSTLWLLTEELGLIVARAQSARKDTAKMRGHLQLFSITRVSLVRGRYVWRVTGTEPVPGSCGELTSAHTRAAFARIAAFVRRMTIVGAAPVEGLFTTVFEVHKGFNTGASLDIEHIELLTIAKVLHSLGYIDERFIARVTAKEMSRNELAREVNAAITASHL